MCAMGVDRNCFKILKMPTIKSDSQANDLTVLSELKDAHFDAY